MNFLYFFILVLCSFSLSCDYQEGDDQGANYRVLRDFLDDYKDVEFEYYENVYVSKIFNKRGTKTLLYCVDYIDGSIYCSFNIIRGGQYVAPYLESFEPEFLTTILDKCMEQGRDLNCNDIFEISGYQFVKLCPNGCRKCVIRLTDHRR